MTTPTPRAALNSLRAIADRFRQSHEPAAELIVLEAIAEIEALRPIAERKSRTRRTQRATGARIAEKHSKKAGRSFDTAGDDGA